MNEKSWLLNTKAIRAAKICINEVQSELGVRLTLTHPDFLNMLNEYSELCDSEHLTERVNRLNEFALKSDSAAENTQKQSQIVPLNASVAAAASNAIDHFNYRQKPKVQVGMTQMTVQIEAEEEKIVFRGKTYPKYREGKVFKGLYRGKLHYN